MNEPVAGWYVDSVDPSQVRYWDGARWTGHLYPIRAAWPVPAGRPPATRPRPPNTAVVVKTLAGALAMSGFAILWIGLMNAPTQPETVDSLEAGGRFALNFIFFLPLLLATVTLVPMGLFGTFSLTRAWTFSSVSIGLAGLSAAGLAAIACTSDTMRSAVPTAPDVAGPALACAVFSMVLTGLAHLLRMRVTT